MASTYPGALDALTNPVAGDMQNAPSHSGQHTNANDAIEAIEAELGTDPSGTAATVKARLTAMDAVDALRVVGSNATTSPSSPVVGQVWVDHSTPATPVIKVWSGSAWVNPSSAGSGGAALVWATVTGGTVTSVTNPDGSTDEVHTFTAGGSLVVSAAGYAQVLLVGGGTGGDSGYIGGGGGAWNEGLIPLPAGSLAVVVGTGGTGGSGQFNTDTIKGKASSLGSVVSTQWGTTALGTTAQPVYTSSIQDGTAKTYAMTAQSSPRANRGDGGNNTGNVNGSAGVVIVRVKVTPAPTLPAATGWAQVTGGTVTEYTKGDGSVMEVHTFTATGSNLTVVAAGYAECLVVGGGSAYQNTAAIEANGGGGDILSGLRALPAGTHAVTVGAGGTGGAPGNPTWQKVGQPSSIGAVLVTAVGRGHSGAGGTPGSASSILTPITSAITGTALTYGQAALTAPRANRGDGSDVGGGSPANGAAGVVIVAVQKTPPTASGVVATGGTESTFTGDGTNGVLGQGYKVHTFTASGSLVVSAAPAGSVVECLLVAGGGGGGYTGQNSGGGGGGGVFIGQVPATVGSLAVTVGDGGAGATVATNRGDAGQPSQVGAYLAAGGGGGGSGGDSAAQKVGGRGGSGGGTSGTTGVAGGAAATEQGYTGGASSATRGGGGGGAGEAGNTDGAGYGGDGLTTLFSGGSAATYGGGGSGGTNYAATGQQGGTGGGGTMSATADTVGANGTANTGGGGSGGNASGANQNGGAGGSGIVIVRYRV